MQDKIDSLVADLTELKGKLDELGDLNAAYNAAEHELNDVKAELEAVKTELESGKAGLSTAQVKNQKEHEEAIYNRRKELEALDGKIEKAQAQLGDLNAHINSATTLHQQIENSLNSMRAKFA
jgi:chromosome segregation ATPase